MGKGKIVMVKGRKSLTREIKVCRNMSIDYAELNWMNKELRLGSKRDCL